MRDSALKISRSIFASPIVFMDVSVHMQFRMLSAQKIIEALKSLMWEIIEISITFARCVRQQNIDSSPSFQPAFERIFQNCPFQSGAFKKRSVSVPYSGRGKQ